MTPKLRSLVFRRRWSTGGSSRRILIMPLTKSGTKVLSSMKKQYGEKKGKEVFYSSINKGKPGSSKWHGKKKSSGPKMHDSGRGTKVW